MVQGVGRTPRRGPEVLDGVALDHCMEAYDMLVVMLCAVILTRVHAKTNLVFGVGTSCHNITWSIVY